MFAPSSTVCVMASRTETRTGTGAAAAVWLLVAAVMITGCATTRPAAFDPARLDEAMENLGRPLPGDMAALYRMRVPKTGGLRLTVITAGYDGRMTVSEPFGGAVSLTAWAAGNPTVFFDMDEGCRLSLIHI